MSDVPVKMAVVGVGYFGTFHCGKIASLPGVELTAVVDIDRKRGQEVASRFGVQQLFTHRELAGKVDAAVVAVPTSAHHEVAVDLLLDGMSLLIEKPLAATVAQAEDLCRLADQRGLRLQVGHLERFNPVFLEAVGRLKRPRYIHMERSGPFHGRGGDVDVVLELMSHDLDILLQLTRERVESVSAVGWSLLTPHLDVAAARIRFQDGLVADLMASRIGSQKVRKFSVLDSDRVLEVDLAGRQVLWVPYNGKKAELERLVINSADPLLEQDRAFVDVLRNGQKPRVGGEAGKATVALATRVLGCIRSGGTR